MLNIEEPDELLAYLRRGGHIGGSERPAIRILTGGVSNRTVLVERPTGESWVLKQALAKLRVPVDWFSSPERVRKEALGLRWLAVLAPARVPNLVFEDPTVHLIAMQAVPPPHENWKTLLLQGRVDGDLVQQFAGLLSTIHVGAYARRDDLAPIFADRSFFESLRLEPYYGFAAEQVPAAAPFLRRLTEETRQRIITLVHGDYSPKNILVHERRLILLDHEVIHWGDPAFDLGFSMTHFLSKAHHLPARRALFCGAAQRYWRHYAAAVKGQPWADRLEPYAVRHTLACLLARVDGRSALEYMDAEERMRQRRVVLTLVANPPADMNDLVRQFVALLNPRETGESSATKTTT